MQQEKFEDKIKRLEDIVKLLEANDVDIEQSVALFEEGVDLFKNCKKQLNSYEAKIKILKDGITESEY